MMINMKVTENTKALLLLAAPLIINHSTSHYNHLLLNVRELNILNELLISRELLPKDLFNKDRLEQIKNILEFPLSYNRIINLLERGFLLAQALDRWTSRGIWVISKYDEGYPKKLIDRLNEHAPLILFGCGDKELFNNTCVAVQGSRKISEEIEYYTKNIGRLSALSGYTIVTGGALGVDRSAVIGSLNASGKAICVLANNLEQKVLGNREVIMNGSLTLISPFDPKAGFNVGNAMQRNKYIFALAESALVINSDFEKGGTWTGAVEQIKKQNNFPMYVRNDLSVKGLVELIKLGGKPWPEPKTVEEFRVILKPNTQIEEIETKDQGILIPNCEDTLFPEAPKVKAKAYISHSAKKKIR